MSGAAGRVSGAVCGERRARRRRRQHCGLAVARLPTPSRTVAQPKLQRLAARGLVGGVARGLELRELVKVAELRRSEEDVRRGRQGAQLFRFVHIALGLAAIRVWASTHFERKLAPPLPTCGHAERSAL